MNHTEIRKFYNISFSIVSSDLGLESKIFDFAVFGQDILPLGSGSVNPHIFAYPIPGSQNLEDPTNTTNPDPKHCFFKIHYYLVVY